MFVDGFFFCFDCLCIISEVLRRGEKDTADMHLYWDSWDRHHALKTAGLSPRIGGGGGGGGRSRAARASVPSEESIAGYNNNNNNNMRSSFGGGGGGGGGGTASNLPPSSSVSSISSLNATTHSVLGPPLTPPPQTRGKGTL